MPLAPAIAAALTTPSAVARAFLFVNGLDLTVERVATGARRYGVDPRTIELHLAAAGGVSRLSFDVDDPFKLLSFTPGDEVRLAYGDDPWFRGILELDEGRPDFGYQGRTWSLTATGLDGLPDWAVTEYDLAWPAAALITDMIQSVVAACGNLGDVRALVDPVNHNGSSDLPIGNLGGASNLSLTAPFVNAVSIPAGTTMRRAFASILASSEDDDVPYQATIDQLGGLRVYGARAAGFPWPGGTITVGTSSTPAGADHRFTVDGTSIVRTVVVIGTGARATVSDGSGKRGRAAVIRDTTLTTTTACRTAGLAYLAETGAGVRGTIAQEDVAWSSADNLAHLAELAIVDASTGATGSYDGGGIDLTVDDRDQVTITYAYGGRPLTASELIRRMTVDPVV